MDDKLCDGIFTEHQYRNIGLNYGFGIHAWQLFEPRISSNTFGGRKVVFRPSLRVLQSAR